METVVVAENLNQLRGKTLEKNVEYIFKTAGFETYTNQFVAKYEIDVVVKIGDRTIIVECKNYQSSSLTIRNLIHEWNSKNNIIKADKVILVLAGLNIKTDDYMLANDVNIEIWDENYLSDLFKMSLDPHNLKKHILESIDLKPDIDIANLYREDITELIIFPLLKGKPISITNIYSHFNDWVRIRARTDLRLNMANVEEINKHIEVFEDTKKKKVLFFNVQRGEIEYWEQLRERLEHSNILPEETSLRYINYMNSLHNEYVNQKKYLNTTVEPNFIKRLIKSRINLLLDSNQDECLLGFSESQQIKIKYTGDLQFKISINYITEEIANIISWLLTSEYKIEIDSNKNFTWISSRVDETAEKVLRIFEEVVGVPENKKLIDYTLIKTY